MKRSGFTMIELIFVIVILGILAAVAVPRLAGVQDDALGATEKSTVGAMRGGVQAISGKIMINSNDDMVYVKAFTEDGTEYLINYDLTSTTAQNGVINHKPIGLNSGATGTPSADDNTTASQVSSDADKTLAAVLEPGSDRDKWNTKQGTTTTNTKMQGPASSTLATDSEAEYNLGGHWLYVPAAGSITWQSGTAY